MKTFNLISIQENIIVTPSIAADTVVTLTIIVPPQGPNYSASTRTKLQCLQKDHIIVPPQGPNYSASTRTKLQCLHKDHIIVPPQGPNYSTSTRTKLQYLHKDQIIVPPQGPNCSASTRTKLQCLHKDQIIVPPQLPNYSAPTRTKLQCLHKDQFMLWSKARFFNKNVYIFSVVSTKTLSKRIWAKYYILYYSYQYILYIANKRGRKIIVLCIVSILIKLFHRSSL